MNSTQISRDHLHRANELAVHENQQYAIDDKIDKNATDAINGIHSDNIYKLEYKTGEGNENDNTDDYKSSNVKAEN